MLNRQPQRLAKILARSGVASRRRCEELIRAGRVSVNGQIAPGMGQLVDPERDEIVLNGSLIACEALHYFAFHKPVGVICSSLGFARALDHFAGVSARLFTVGRLDVATSGLLLVTNDGSFANRVMHPSYGVAREYLVKTTQECSPQQLRQLRSGARIDDQWLIPYSVLSAPRAAVKIVVGEGKYREIRRLFAAHGLEISQLIRIRIGDLILGSLPSGAWRALSQKELRAAQAPRKGLLRRSQPRSSDE